MLAGFVQKNRFTFSIALQKIRNDCLTSGIGGEVNGFARHGGGVNASGEIGVGKCVANEVVKEELLAVIPRFPVHLVQRVDGVLGYGIDH